MTYLLVEQKIFQILLVFLETHTEYNMYVRTIYYYYFVTVKIKIISTINYSIILVSAVSITRVKERALHIIFCANCIRDWSVTLPKLANTVFKNS